jgi:hypothetical protein
MAAPLYTQEQVEVMMKTEKYVKYDEWQSRNENPTKKAVENRP